MKWTEIMKITRNQFVALGNHWSGQFIFSQIWAYRYIYIDVVELRICY
jgi:hypothetical protein